MMYDSKLCRRVETARLLISVRDAVGEMLEPTICPNPVWDMLLDLYVAHYEHRELYLWPLCIAAKCALSTGHRKVRFMEVHGLVSRGNCGHDRRRSTVAMTEMGFETMNRILDRVSERTEGVIPDRAALAWSEMQQQSC